jgi:hypothetical protein
MAETAKNLFAKKGMGISLRCCNSPICVFLIMTLMVFKSQNSKERRTMSLHDLISKSYKVFILRILYELSHINFSF